MVFNLFEGGEMKLKSKTKEFEITSKTVHSFESSLINIDYKNMLITFKDDALELLDRRHKSPIIKFFKEALLNDESEITIIELDGIKQDTASKNIDFIQTFNIISDFMSYIKTNKVHEITEKDIILYIGTLAIKEHK